MELGPQVAGCVLLCPAGIVAGVSDHVIMAGPRQSLSAGVDEAVDVRNLGLQLRHHRRLLIRLIQALDVARVACGGRGAAALASVRGTRVQGSDRQAAGTV